MPEHRAAAQVDLLNAAVGAHIGRGTGGDQLAPVQNDDPVRMGEDHVHVVLGEQHGDVPLPHQFRRSAPSARCARAEPCRRSARPSAAGTDRLPAPSPVPPASGRHRPARRRAGRPGMPSRPVPAAPSPSAICRRAARPQKSNSRRWCDSSTIWIFSSTVMEPKVAVIWKVRPTPSRQTWRGDFPRRLVPFSLTSPASGAIWPFSMLKQVVLPAPLGPTSASNSPRRPRS